MRYATLIQSNFAGRVKFLVSILAISNFVIYPFNLALAQKINDNETQVSNTKGSSGNWMSDFVRFRVLERNLRAVSPDNQKLKSGFRAAVGNDNVMSEMLHAQARIIGGVGANKEDNPFQVALLMKEESDNFNAQFCGGTLIGQNFVVTAAHCSDFIDATQVEVLTGTRKLDGTGDRHKVSKIHIHPNWNKSTFDNDVAVWKLETNVTNIPFPSLAKEDGLVGKEDPPAGKEDLLVSGWGFTKENGARIVDLQKVLVPLVDRKNCNDNNSYNGQITENMLCAGFNKGTQDACQGDSGGPLTRKNGKSDTLTGIVSWGYGCARPNLFGVYTRVSNANIRDFIENIINAP